ncbi:hypothetical protein [Bradyrhizobium diazoefficiens]
MRPDHVEGKGDVLYRGFQCLNPECTNFIFIEDSEITDDFEIKCERCKFKHVAGETKSIFKYELKDERDQGATETGDFEILVDDYIGEAKGYKYCILCCGLKPIELFDKHSARKTGRQGECNLCKQVYNSIKNKTRLTEQHREASQKRRLYTELSSSSRIDLGKIYEKFDSKCFKCGCNLSSDRDGGKAALLGNLDHTLPAKFLWPLTTDNATLLCKNHNGQKSERWPGEFYGDRDLRRLSPIVGIDYRVLKGNPHFNPDALGRLKDPAFVEALFVKYARYQDELVGLRNKILKAEKFDFFKSWPKISKDLIKRADDLLKS